MSSTNQPLFHCPLFWHRYCLALPSPPHFVLGFSWQRPLVSLLLLLTHRARSAQDEYEGGLLTRRATEEVVDPFFQYAEEVLLTQFGKANPLGMIDLWDTTVGVRYPYLIVSRVQSWLASDAWYETFRGGVRQVIRYLVCNLEYMNKLLEKRSSTISCTSTERSCGSDEGGLQKRARSLAWKASIYGITYNGVVEALGVSTVKQWRSE